METIVLRNILENKCSILVQLTVKGTSYGVPSAGKGLYEDKSHLILTTIILIRQYYPDCSNEETEAKYVTHHPSSKVKDLTFKTSPTVHSICSLSSQHMSQTLYQVLLMREQKTPLDTSGA